MVVTMKTNNQKRNTVLSKPLRVSISDRKQKKNKVQLESMPNKVFGNGAIIGKTDKRGR